MQATLAARSLHGHVGSAGGKHIAIGDKYRGWRSIIVDESGAAILLGDHRSTHAKELAVSWDFTSCEGAERHLQPNPEAGWPAAAPAAGGGARYNAQGSNRRLTSLSKLAGTPIAGRFRGDSHATNIGREATGSLSEGATPTPSSGHLEGDRNGGTGASMAVGPNVPTALKAGTLTLVPNCS